MSYVKGGAWTNIEDEVLKASVAKYGLNQWARVSSLLARKTAKQCKARWTEWLDPTIRKVEWTREEDEKLLHLAKLMPTQWRTIAPLVGRTATQCLLRYDKLMTEKERGWKTDGEVEGQKDDDELGLGGPTGGETQPPSADDVRKLRPGEEDPLPEHKPALPDTVDMDEDEKEMLSEARARLANTKGKKAKRKIRERQVEDSRRVAALQKRRELKATGINIKINNRKPGQMDYNADIPFEKAPVPGFYDTREEQGQNERARESFDPRKQQLANKRKQAAQNETDDNNRKRQKHDKSSSNLSAEAAKAGQAMRIREAERQSRRGVLSLPAPQVGEEELESIVKMGLEGQRAENVASVEGNQTTRGLMGDYPSQVNSTPVRTPRIPQGEDRIANEVRNARLRTETQSALLGGDNPELDEGDSTTGYEGAAPSKNITATPNSMATPLRQMNGRWPGQTPDQHLGATPMRTARDDFRLNDQTPLMTPGQRDNEIEILHKHRKSGIGAKLSALPKPKQTEWELQLRNEKHEPSTVQERSQQEDAALRDARNAAIKAEKERQEFRRQTTVVQRGLPIPRADTLNKVSLLTSFNNINDHVASALAEEMASLITRDAIKLGERKEENVPPLDEISTNDLEKARMEIALEVSNVAGNKDDNIKAIYDALEKAHDWWTPQHLTMARFEQAEQRLMEKAEKANKVEKKLSKLLGGYQMRAKTLREKILQAYDAWEKTGIEMNTQLHAQLREQTTINFRLEIAREEVQTVMKRERAAQGAYKAARAEFEELEQQEREILQST